MDKQTDAEKELHKRARSLRDAAFNARAKACRKATEAAEQAAEATAEYAAWQSAEGAMDAARDALKRACEELDDQIAALERKKQKLREEAELRHSDLKDARSKTSRAYFNKKQELVHSATEEFADVAGLHGPGSWKPVSAFLEQAKSAPPAKAKKS